MQITLIYYKRTTFWYLLVVILWGCNSIPDNVEKALILSGDNRHELEKVIHYYRNDKQKLQAAYYLIANMRYHKSEYIISSSFSEYHNYFLYVDSIYSSIFQKDTRINKINLEAYEKLRKNIGDSIFSQLPSFKKEFIEISDLNSITSDFLIDNIECAFEAWTESPYAQNIDTETFYEFILPYRTTTEPLMYKRSEIKDLFKNNIGADHTSNIYDCIEQYKAYIKNSKWLNEYTNPGEHLGIYDLFLPKFNSDCHNIASWTSNVFRACGIPTVYEYTSRWKERDKLHFWCSSPDSTGIFLPYTPPDNNLKEDCNTDLKLAGKVYRKTFGAQTDTPYFLRNKKDEYIPDNLSSPLLSDQTFRYHQSVSLHVPFHIPTTNSLAYLCFFSRNDDGLIPVGWGKINSMKNTVTFEQVPLNTLFFTAYYEDDILIPFGEPFILQTLGNSESVPLPLTRNKLTPKENLHIHITKNQSGDYSKSNAHNDIYYMPIRCNNDSLINLTVLRKFPQKRKLRKIQDKLTGAVILGHNNKNEKADTLAIIKIPPKPYIQDIYLQNNKKYHYYTLTATDKRALDIAHIEFLGPYSEAHNCVNPTPLPVFDNQESKKGETEIFRFNSKKIKIENDSTLLPDNNMETYISSSSIGIEFKIPALITHVRFIPRNANNMIVVGNKYALWYFDKQWIKHSEITAHKNFLFIEDVPSKTVYWVQNLTVGKEELPFFYAENNQYFINLDTIPNYLNFY